EAGGFPEVFLTAFSNLFMLRLGHLAPGETALVHGGGGGVGTAAILLLRGAGHRVIVTAGSEAKCRRCLELGATAAIDYRTEDFAARARELTGGRGVEVILDHIGGRSLAAGRALGAGRSAAREDPHQRADAAAVSLRCLGVAAVVPPPRAARPRATRGATRRAQHGGTPAPAQARSTAPGARLDPC